MNAVVIAAKISAAMVRVPVITASFCIVCPWLGWLSVISTNAGDHGPVKAGQRQAGVHHRADGAGSAAPGFRW